MPAYNDDIQNSVRSQSADLLLKERREAKIMHVIVYN